MPSVYSTTDLVGFVDSHSVLNTYDWDITRVQLMTFMYGTHRKEVFEMPWLNISSIELFLLKALPAENSASVELQDLSGTSKSSEKNKEDTEWTLEWWQIIPQAVRYERTRMNETRPSLPLGLRDRLLDRGEPGSGISTNNISDTMVQGRDVDLITVAFTLMIVFGILTTAVIVVCLTVLVALVLTRRFAPSESRTDGGSDGEQERLLDENR